MRQMWPHLCNGVARLYAPPPADLGIIKQTRLAPGSDPRLAWAESASLAIGIPSLSIYVPPLDDLWIAALDSPEPSLALGRGVVGGDPVSRFRVGRALALVRECATILDRIAPAELDLIWNAALYPGQSEMVRARAPALRSGDPAGCCQEARQGPLAPGDQGPRVPSACPSSRPAWTWSAGGTRS